ncbi:PIG-X/PBN1 family protein [Sporobolomyces koalae]|uniref:PIG-X/PBN1 family protein n=1 Tax=Sporobolomyces koalae TaxID=500713 RepID=UPI0031808BC7
MPVKTTLLPEQGFHPTLHLSIDPTPSPNAERCRLFTWISFPQSFIVDRYQLAQLHDEGKLGLSNGTFQVRGDSNLEGPEWTAEPVSILVQLSSPDPFATDDEEEFKLDVPVHLRYQRPTKIPRTKTLRVQDRVSVSIDPPRVFWACEPGDQTLDSTTTSSFVGCPPSSLSTRTSFPSIDNSTLYYVDSRDSCSSPRPDPSVPPLQVSLPTGVETDSAFVGPVTVVIIWLGFVYLVWTTFSVARNSSRRIWNQKSQ